MEIPKWSEEIIGKYKSAAYNQFIIFGNVPDKLVMPFGQLGNLEDFFKDGLLSPFNIILSFDIGNGLRCLKGEEYLSGGGFIEDMPKQPRAAIEVVNRIFLYLRNKDAIQHQKIHLAVIIRDANLVVPNAGTAVSYDLNATASMIRDWSRDSGYLKSNFCSFIVSENLNELHPLITNNERATSVLVPLPSSSDLYNFLNLFGKLYPTALKNFAGSDGMSIIANKLTGISVADFESQLKHQEFNKKPLEVYHLVQIKKKLIERQADGLIEFVESNLTLDAIEGHDAMKKAIRGMLNNWDRGLLSSNPMVQKRTPMGVLFSGPVGCSKTYTVKCLAGEAGVPVVIVKNFRGKYVGDTEAKQEKVIRLIKGLGRCIVFFDEASATLGKRSSGDGDSGLSQRVYSTWAQEMSNPSNRGYIIWVMADSRPDNIEIDLKRPGRIDIMIPLFPAGTPEQGFKLLQSLCKREGIAIPDDKTLNALIPTLLTAGAAEALAKKIATEIDLDKLTVEQAVFACLKDYRPPIAISKLEEQIRLACEHCTDMDFVPKEFAEYMPH